MINNIMRTKKIDGHGLSKGPNDLVAVPNPLGYLERLVSGHLNI